MACAATLKRSLEFDPVHSPSHSSAKRRRCLPITLAFTKASENNQRYHASPFAGVAQKMSSEQITISIAQEVKRMQRRRQLHYPSASQCAKVTSEISLEPGKAEDSSLCSSPEQSPQSQSLTSLFGNMPTAKKDVPLFTFRQVSLLCERLLHDREEGIKEEYDKVLSCKLADQYEAFLKFNHDQLHRQLGHSEMSYVS